MANFWEMRHSDDLYDFLYEKAEEAVTNFIKNNKILGES